MTADSQVYCKDCIHSHVSWVAYIATWGNPKSTDYICKAYPLDDKISIVTGPKKPTSYYSCYGARTYDGLCGEHGKKWTPKELTNEHLIKVLQKPS